MACAIKDFYLETSVNELSLNETSIEPFFEKHGVDEKKFPPYGSISIENYFVDYFDISIYVGQDLPSRPSLHASVSFSWGGGNGPFKTMYENIRTLDNENIPEGESISPHVERIIDRFHKGEYTPAKKLCAFIKEYAEYINKPRLKDYFIDYYAHNWSQVKLRNHNKLRNPSPAIQKKYENSVKQYF